MAIQATPAQDENYVVGQDTERIGRENQSAELFINKLFNTNYITQFEPRTYIKVDPLVSDLTREVVTDTAPASATVPNNRTVK